MPETPKQEVERINREADDIRMLREELEEEFRNEPLPVKDEYDEHRRVDNRERARDMNK